MTEKEKIIEMFRDLAHDDVIAIIGTERGKTQEERCLHRNQKRAIDGKFDVFRSILVDVYQMPLDDVVKIYEDEFNRLKAPIEELFDVKIDRY